MDAGGTNNGDIVELFGPESCSKRFPGTALLIDVGGGGRAENSGEKGILRGGGCCCCGCSCWRGF